MNNNEVIKKLQIKNGKLQVQIERLKLDKEEYYLDYLELQDRIHKALDLLKTLDEDTLSNMQLASEIIGHIEYILRGEENESN